MKQEEGPKKERVRTKRSRGRKGEQGGRGGEWYEGRGGAEEKRSRK